METMTNDMKQATPHEQLIGELLDSTIPKTEREHAAAREIERLQELLAFALEKLKRRQNFHSGSDNVLVFRDVQDLIDDNRHGSE